MKAVTKLIGIRTISAVEKEIADQADSVFRMIGTRQPELQKDVFRNLYFWDGVSQKSKDLLPTPNVYHWHPVAFVENMMKMQGFSFLKPQRHVNTVFLHCSASDNFEHDNAATMDKWHKERGWNGIGYHFFIRKDGTIEMGRDLEKEPIAQQGYNAGTIAICLHGLEKKNFTGDQYESLRILCQSIQDAYPIFIKFRGHCEVAPKTCPVFDYKSVLSLDESGYIK